MRLDGPRLAWDNVRMHTHFGSATHALGTFLSVLIVGTFWRLAWMHAMAIGMKRNLGFLAGLARAALAQY